MKNKNTALDSDKGSFYRQKESNILNYIDEIVKDNQYSNNNRIIRTQNNAEIPKGFIKDLNPENFSKDVKNLGRPASQSS
jgi:hypothetical protein